MANNTFIFDSVASSTFNLLVYDGGTDDMPEKIYDTVQIAGKNGYDILDEGRYDNIDHPYSCLIYENCEAKLAELRSFLSATIGYKRLEDSMHPDEFYLAKASMPLNVVMHKDRDMAKFTLAFDRKPQRWLKSGENAISFTSGGTISNPTYNASKPLVRAYGTGYFTLGGVRVNISSSYSRAYIDIDCELMDAYHGSNNMNEYISIVGNEFPTIPSGQSNVVINGLSKIDVTPRWYRI